ncbi:coth-domain-containing protein [Backusella circina FSU 941]|nr:coth-domain-containing protein [Backusella circina FSU 941]
MILSFVLIYFCSFIHAIRYSVITSADKAGVLVDGKYYQLKPTWHHVLFRGEAPVARYGYTYVKTISQHSRREKFLRHPVSTDTVNEFYNRTWNHRHVEPLTSIYPPLQPIIGNSSSLHPEGQIPTIHFKGSASKIEHMHNDPQSKKHVQVDMSFIGLENELEFKKVKLQLSGRSSRKMAKLSYKFELDKKDLLYGYREFKLRSMFLDPSYLREQIGYDFANAMGLATSQSSFVRVFVNGKELGLFGLIETFEAPWSANTLEGNGGLYQGKRTDVLADLGYYSNHGAYKKGQYELKQKGTTSGLQPIIDFTQFIHEGSTSVVEWNKWINVDSFLRSMALEVTLGFMDGYLAQANNYYLYQIPDGQFIYIPYDMDSILGITYFNPEAMLSGNYSDFPNLYKRPLMRQLLRVPEFEHRFNQIILRIARYIPHKTKRRIDQLANMIAQDVEWDQSIPHVSTNLFSFDQKNPIDAMGATYRTELLASVRKLGISLPTGVNQTLIRDFVQWLSDRSVPFKRAVNGPTGHPSLYGLKEWLRLSSQAIQRFYLK